MATGIQSSQNMKFLWRHQPLLSVYIQKIKLMNCITVQTKILNPKFRLGLSKSRKTINGKIFFSSKNILFNVKK